MKKALYIAGLRLKKNLKQPGLFLIMLMLPLLFTFLMGSITAGGKQGIPLAIVDEDHSSYSDRLMEIMQQDTAFRVISLDREGAIGAVRDYSAVAAFVLPKGFGAAMEKGNKPTIDVFKVATTGELAMAENALRMNMTKMDANLRIADLALQEIKGDKEIEGKEDAIRERAYRNAVGKWFPSPPVGLLVESLNENPASAYDPMSHAAIGFALFFSMYTIVFSMGEILEEKKQGTWSRLSTLPVSPGHLLTGYMLGTFIVGFLQIMILFLAGKYLFGVNWGPHLGISILTVAAFIFCISCLGLLLIGLVKTQRQLQAIAPLLLVSTSMLGGLFWPLEMVQSPFLLALSKVIPQSWAAAALRDLAYGNKVEVVLPAIGILILMGGVLFAAGLWKFQKDENV